MTALRTQAFAQLLLARKAKLYRAKAELLELTIPIKNYEQFTRPEWEALAEMMNATTVALSAIDAELAINEAIKP